MNDIIAILIELQSIDRELIDGERQSEATRQVLVETADRLKREEDELGKINTDLNVLQKEKRGKEQKLKELEDRRAKLRVKEKLLKTSREIEVLTRELDVIDKEIATIETEVVEILDGVEGMQKRVNAHAVKYEKLEAEHRAAREHVEKETKRIHDSLKDRAASRKRLLAKLDRETVTHYERVIKLRKGLAVVPVVKEACQGCHMNIPPQLNIELQRNTALHRCPLCNRFIFFQAVPAPEEAAEE